MRMIRRFSAFSSLLTIFSMMVSFLPSFIPSANPVPEAQAQTPSALASLAASMAPGTWAQLAQPNINAILGRGDREAHMIPYSFTAPWDPIRLKLH